MSLKQGDGWWFLGFLDSGNGKRFCQGVIDTLGQQTSDINSETSESINPCRKLVMDAQQACEVE